MLIVLLTAVAAASEQDGPLYWWRLGREGQPLEQGCDSLGVLRQRFAAGEIGRDELLKAESMSYHSPGTCTFYGTANSNQLMLDFMGLQFPGGAFELPSSPQRKALIGESVRALESATRNPALKFGTLVDSRCLINALVGLMASGG